MAFFKREQGPIERLEHALRDKEAARRKLSDRLNVAEAELAEKRAAAERLAVGGASDDKLDRAEAGMRSVKDRVRTLRAALTEADEQIALTERALTDATAQHERELLADQIEAMAAAIERAAPAFRASATALAQAVTKTGVSLPAATHFSASVEALRREILSAADLVCWELRTIAVQTRAGNANVTSGAMAEPEQPASPETGRQLVYTLNPLLWREGDEVWKCPAFALVELPKALLSVALRHQHVDHLSARRVQTLMHVHGSEGGELPDDIAQFVDLDVLAAADDRGIKAHVA